MTNGAYDVAILGSGPGGYVAALRAAQLGLKTAVIEKDPGKFGGTCLHRGCIPTKIFLQAAHLYERVRDDAETYGIVTGDVSFDWPKLLSLKSRILKRLNGGVEMLLKRGRVTILQGHGRLKGPKTLDVGGTEVKAGAVIIATGAEARTVPSLPFDGKNILSNVEALDLPALPKSLLVVGAGVSGLEFASMFHSFGVDVTVVEILPHALTNEDEEVRDAIVKILRKKGLKLLFETKVETAVVKKGGVEATLVGKDGKTEKATFDKALVSIGRKPNTDQIGIETTKAKLDRGFIKVDGFCQTDDPGLYAIGDVNPSPQLAHVASAEGITAVEKLKGLHVEPMNYDRIPSVTFSNPQVASIGLSEAAAKKRGHDVRVGRFPLAALGMAQIVGETEGFVKIVSESKYGEILGMHVLHAHASEFVGEMTAALNGEMTVEALAHSVHAHPTLSEAIQEAAHGALGGAIHA